MHYDLQSSASISELDFDGQTIRNEKGGTSSIFEPGNPYSLSIAELNLSMQQFPEGHMSRSTKSLYIIICLILTLSLFLTGCDTSATKNTVKIAFIGPFTGGNAAMGLGGRNSFKLAIDEINAVATNKYKYEVVYIDDECKPDVGVQAALKAGSDPAVIASASHYCSMVAVSTADTFHQQGLPSMVWGAVLPSITYGNDYIEVTRVNGTQIQQNQVNAQLIWDLGFRKVSIIHDTSDYGRGHTEYFLRPGRN